MRRIVLGFFLFIAFISMSEVNAQSINLPLATYIPSLPVSYRNISEIVLEDGVYEVVVEYESSSSHSATYKLDVYIKNDTVERIYFNNGGSLHSGYNNSDYTYRGGGIYFKTDYEGNIIGGEAKIQVTYNNNTWQYFIIHI